MIYIKGRNEGLVFIEQFASKITYYSSQYGHVNGVSYTANNLVGPPSRFPAYGDYSETYVPVTMNFYTVSLFCYCFHNFLMFYRDPMGLGGLNPLVHHQ